MVKNTIIFDTRTKWTGVIVNGVEYAPFSNYIVKDSTTAIAIKSEATDGAEEATFVMDQVKFDANLYRE